MVALVVSAPLALQSCATAPPLHEASTWLDVGEQKVFVTGVREGSVVSVSVGVPQEVDEPWRDQQRLARAEDVSLQAWLDSYPLPLADRPSPGVLPFSRTPTGGYGLANFAFDLPSDLRAANVRLRLRLRRQVREFTLEL